MSGTLAFYFLFLLDGAQLLLVNFFPHGAVYHIFQNLSTSLEINFQPLSMLTL